MYSPRLARRTSTLGSRGPYTLSLNFFIFFLNFFTGGAPRWRCFGARRSQIARRPPRGPGVRRDACSGVVSSSGVVVGAHSTACHASEILAITVTPPHRSQPHGTAARLRDAAAAQGRRLRRHLLPRDQRPAERRLTLTLTPTLTLILPQPQP